MRQPARPLLQECVGAHRWNPLPLNRADDATPAAITLPEGRVTEELGAALLKLPAGTPPGVIEDLGKRFGKDMIIAHRPDLGGVYITPLDPRISLADRARMMSEKRAGLGYSLWACETGDGHGLFSWESGSLPRFS